MPLVAEQLTSEGLPTDTLGRSTPADAQLATTASRSVLGVMNDTATHARYRIEAVGGIDQVDSVSLNHFLRRALHTRAGEHVTPLGLVARRLED